MCASVKMTYGIIHASEHDTAIFIEWAELLINSVIITTAILDLPLALSYFHNHDVSETIAFTIIR